MTTQFDRDVNTIRLAHGIEADIAEYQMRVAKSKLDLEHYGNRIVHLIKMLEAIMKLQDESEDESKE